MKNFTREKIESTIRRLEEILNNDNGGGDILPDMPENSEEVMIHVKLKIVSQLIVAQSREELKKILRSAHDNAEQEVVDAMNELKITSLQ